MVYKNTGILLLLVLFFVTPVVAEPIITLLGDNPIDVEIYSEYTDAGATASDDIDGDLTSSINTINPVNTAIIGTYTVTYNVLNTSSYPAIEVTRTVHVIDGTPPIITLLGDNPIDVDLNSVYTDAGATALDNEDDNLTSSIITVNPVNTAIKGTYNVTYNVNDSSNNPATEVKRTVNVVDNTPPVITLIGNDPETVQAGTSYTEAGATVTDNYDTGLNASITESVNTAVVGSYTLTYNAVDSSSNTAIPVTRKINVVDTLPPVWFPTPQNQIVQVGVSFSYDVRATDASTIVYSINDNSNFTINSESGNIKNKKKLIEGNYILNITATDAFYNSIFRIITVTVQPEPTYSVSGYVFGDNNTGFEGVNIQNGTTNLTISIVTGYYVINGLLNGSYQFSYSKSGFNNNNSIVTINGSDVTNVNMTLAGISVTVTPPPSRGGGGGSSGGGGGGGGSSGEAFLNIMVKEKYDLFIYKDIVTSYKFANIDNPIIVINIVGNVNAGEIGTAVEVLKNTSSLVKSSAPGNVYRNVNIWVGTSGFGTSKNIKQALIKFRIPNSWINSNNIKTSGLKMVRWDGSIWNQLETSEKLKDDTYTYFESKTDGFSSFAITGTETTEIVTETAYMRETIETAEPTATIQEENKSDFLMNWFMIIGVFFAIGLVIEVYVRMKKK